LEDVEVKTLYRVPVGMNLTAEKHDALSIDEEGVFIPSNLAKSDRVHVKGAAYILLQELPRCLSWNEG